MNCLCRTFCVSVGLVFIVATLIFGHTSIAKSFHQLRLHALSIQNVSLCRSESRSTPAISMKEVILTIVNDWLIVNYYRKELFFRYGNGFDTRKKNSNGREFSHSKLKDSWQQIKNNQSILCQSSLFPFKKTILSKELASFIKTYIIIPTMFLTSAIPNKFVRYST